MPLAVNVLTSSTRTMLSETTTATMEAQNRNILKSAAAWIRFNTDKLTENKKGHTMLLDTAVPDRIVAEKFLDALLEANREYLPRFYA